MKKENSKHIAHSHKLISNQIVFFFTFVSFFLLQFVTLENIRFWYHCFNLRDLFLSLTVSFTLSLNYWLDLYNKTFVTHKKVYQQCVFGGIGERDKDTRNGKYFPAQIYNLRCRKKWNFLNNCTSGTWNAEVFFYQKTCNYLSPFYTSFTEWIVEEYTVFSCLDEAFVSIQVEMWV